LISPDEVERHFQPFQRQGTERIRHASGHGLGLAIVSVHDAALPANAQAEGGLDIKVSFP
jgi:K+-sensing histidine kinase KdpD